MEIIELDREKYKGTKFTARYTTEGYYDIEINDETFSFVYKKFDRAVEKSFDDTFFGEWLDHPKAFGAFENNQLIGFVEGAIEEWNHRYRISNICIFEDEFRKMGIGRLLMSQMIKEAEKSGARMVVLETQTCNTTAIDFYKSFGFEIIGFDLFAYSNEDLKNREVRIEMGKKLSPHPAQ